MLDGTVHINNIEIVEPVADTEFGSGEIIKKCVEWKSKILNKYISHILFHPSYPPLGYIPPWIRA